AEQAELKADDDAVPAPDGRVARGRQRAGGPLGHHDPGRGEQRAQHRAHGERNHQPRWRVRLAPPEPDEGEEPLHDDGDATAAPGRKRALHRPILTAPPTRDPGGVRGRAALARAGECPGGPGGVGQLRFGNVAEIHDLTVLELAAAVRRRELSPTEITGHYLDRIERLNAEVGAFYTVTADLARDQASQAEKAVTQAGDPRDLPPLT